VIAVALVASYFLGAIPTSYLVGRIFRGIDLRQHGSRNLGATNLFRTLGWRFAVPAGLFDIAKGAIPVLLFAPMASPSRLIALACGACAVLGHVFSIFVRFRGGKGVATAAGVMLGLAPLAFGIVAVIWLTVILATGYVSLGSITAAALLPVAILLVRAGDWPLFVGCTVIAAAVIWLHRANIRRLIAGTENRFGRRGRAATP
jgi:acyl phosphate:glycerol-3-phosphate acyltransferase